MARINQFTDSHGADHPDMFWVDEFTLQPQLERLIIRSWGYHDRPSFNQGLEPVTSKVYIIEGPEFRSSWRRHINQQVDMFSLADEKVREKDLFWEGSQSVDITPQGERE